ncbi:hypothetical protein OS493_019207 [Desmophyllum pertusum]|uniref:Collagen n=1 Tax=Desmophyllum pertusum TaxID=174260 RepID=A0A9W9YBX6_9CNID|nr:hypothetical protein OS493_019207 [Desmophyllum pertusum]
MADQASNEVLARTTQVTNNNAKLERFRRVISSPSSSNDSAYIREVLEDIFTSSLKICKKRGNFNVCPRGRPGTPGRAGTQGDQGRRGSQGVMGQPGRSGKQGIAGPPGIEGEKGIKGDTGAPGIPGIKGDVRGTRYPRD